jgi:hypothetical protein
LLQPTVPNTNCQQALACAQQTLHCLQALVCAQQTLHCQQVLTCAQQTQSCQQALACAQQAPSIFQQALACAQQTPPICQQALVCMQQVGIKTRHLSWLLHPSKTSTQKVQASRILLPQTTIQFHHSSLLLSQLLREHLKSFFGHLASCLMHYLLREHDLLQISFDLAISTVPR